MMNVSIDSAEKLQISHKLIKSAFEQIQEIGAELEHQNIMLKSKNSLHLGKMSVINDRYNRLFEEGFGYDPQDVISRLKGSGSVLSVTHHLTSISVSVY